MERPIMKDILFLRQPSEPATEADKTLILDLQDTLNAHRDHCVGMAANMIGVKKKMIVVAMGFMPVVMINPRNRYDLSVNPVSSYTSLRRHSSGVSFSKK